MRKTILLPLVELPMPSLASPWTLSNANWKKYDSEVTCLW